MFALLQVHVSQLTLDPRQIQGVSFFSIHRHRYWVLWTTLFTRISIRIARSFLEQYYDTELENFKAFLRNALCKIVAERRSSTLDERYWWVMIINSTKYDLIFQVRHCFFYRRNIGLSKCWKIFSCNLFMGYFHDGTEKYVFWKFQST